MKRSYSKTNIFCQKKDKIDSITNNDMKTKTRNGLNKVEYLLNRMAFSILVDINEKRSKEVKQELIEELSDMLKS